MELSVSEAAKRLGKSPRTIRYLAANGRIAARRIGGRWVVEVAPLGDDETVPGAASERGAGRYGWDRQAESGEAAADIGSEPRGFESVRELPVWQLATALYLDLSEVVPDGSYQAGLLSDAREALKRHMQLLVDACHQHRLQASIEQFGQARSAACAAVAELLRYNLFQKEPDLSPLVDRLERDVLTSLTETIRSQEARRAERA